MTKYGNSELKMIFKKRSGMCFYCGDRLFLESYGKTHLEGSWEVDHRWPASKGGPKLLINLVPACISCNRKKGNQFAVTYMLVNLRNWMML